MTPRLPALVLLILLLGPGASLAARPLRVHVVRGLWSEAWGIEAALAEMGSAVVTDAWVRMRSGSGWPSPNDKGQAAGVRGWPGPYGLAGTDLVVLAHVHGNALSAEARRSLARWTRRGGAVLMLGGRFAYGPPYRNELETIAPVTFAREAWDLLHAPGGWPLSGAAGEMGGALFWMHRIEPRAGARTWWRAGGHPALVTGEHERGRVAVVAATVMGEAPEGVRPFWRSAAWPAHLAELLEWLAAAPGPGGLPEPMRRRLESAAGRIEPMKAPMRRRVSGDLERAARAARSPEEAREVARWLKRSGIRVHSRRASRAIAHALAPWARAEDAELGRGLLATGTPTGIRLGLGMLAAGEAAADRRVVTEALRQGRVEAGKPKRTGGDGLGLDMMEAPSLEEGGAGGGAGGGLSPELVRESAMLAMAAHPHPDWGPALEAAAPHVRAGAFKAGQAPGAAPRLLEPAHRLHQAWVLARARVGPEPGHAAELARVLTANETLRSRQRSWKNRPDHELEAMARNHPVLVQWQAHLLERIASAPPLHRALAPLLEAHAGPGRRRLLAAVGTAP